MHYKNGRPANNGDKVLFIPRYGSPLVGILYDAQPGNNDCNGRLAVTLGSDPMPDLKDCLHIDDVKAVTIPDSTAQVSPVLDDRWKSAVPPYVPPPEPPVLDGVVELQASRDSWEKPVETAVNGCPDCGAVEGHTRGCSRY